MKELCTVLAPYRVYTGLPDGRCQVGCIKTSLPRSAAATAASMLMTDATHGLPVTLPGKPAAWWQVSNAARASMAGLIAAPTPYNLCMFVPSELHASEIHPVNTARRAAPAKPSDKRPCLCQLTCFLTGVKGPRSEHRAGNCMCAIRSPPA